MDDASRRLSSRSSDGGSSVVALACHSELDFGCCVVSLDSSRSSMSGFGTLHKRSGLFFCWSQLYFCLKEGFRGVNNYYEFSFRLLTDCVIDRFTSVIGNLHFRAYMFVCWRDVICFFVNDWILIFCWFSIDIRVMDCFLPWWCVCTPVCALFDNGIMLNKYRSVFVEHENQEKRLNHELFLMNAYLVSLICDENRISLIFFIRMKPCL